MKTALAILFACAATLNAANYFVRPASFGSANGSNWDNAWSPGAISWGGVAAGDVFYLSGGTYTNSLTVGASGSAGSRIIIRRAVATDSAATSATGWSAGFDSQVVFTNRFTSTNTFIGFKWDASAGDYVTVDGRTDSGISIRISDQTSPSDYWQSGLCVWFNTANNGVILTNLEMAGPGNSGGFPFVAASTGIYVNGANIKTNLLVTHCRFRDMVQGIQVGTSLLGSTVEYCYFYNFLPTTPVGNPIQHDNIFWAAGCSNITFRFNQCYNWATEGLLLTDSGGAGNGRWDIYGNVFRDSGATGRIYENQATNGPVYFINNTCADVPGFGIRIFSGPTNVFITNNIFYNVGAVDPVTRDYNLYSSATTEAHGVGYGVSGMFNNYAAKDFRIVSTVATNFPRAKGLAVASPYNIDPLGNLRTGVAIGAYEFADTSLTTTTLNVTTLIIGP